MAHQFECTRCGHQEATHDFPNDYPGVCFAYISPDPEGERLMWMIERGEKIEIENQKRRARGVADDL